MLLTFWTYNEIRYIITKCWITEGFRHARGRSFFARTWKIAEISSDKILRIGGQIGLKIETRLQGRRPRPGYARRLPQHALAYHVPRFLLGLRQPNNIR